MAKSVTRRNSEYSASNAPKDHTVQVNDDEKKRAQGEIYRKLFQDPLAKIAWFPSMIAGAAPCLGFFIFGNVLTIMTDFAAGKHPKPVKDIIPYIWWQFGLTLLIGICAFFSTLLWTRIGARLNVRLRHELFSNMMRYDVTFFDMHEIGGLLTVLGEDAAVIQECFGTTKATQFRNLGQFVIGLILVFVQSWKNGLIFLCLVPITILIMRLFHPHIERNAIIRFKHVSAEMTIAEETLSTIRTVRGFNAEEREVRRFMVQSSHAGKRDQNIGLLLATMFTAVLIFEWAEILGNFYYSATEVGKIVNGALFQSGQVFSIFGYMFFGGFAMILLQDSLQAENRAITAGARFSKLMAYTPSVPYDDGIALNDFQGNIEFRNVSFKYPTRDSYVLNNVSFTVHAGEIAALVGHSGSGKSTCVQLLERYYDATEGLVLLDGHDIRTLNPRWLHHKIALVSQEPTLFQLSVRDNVLYGLKHDRTNLEKDRCNDQINDQHVSEGEVRVALEIANASKFVAKLDNGLDQLVGEGGGCLSGGQRQRIAIARACIRNPVIMITDEATSALDSGSEKKVQAALDKVLEGRTAVVVAHRLSTIRNAHIIYVFDTGKIVEVGKHDELVKKQGPYYNLVKRQLGKETLQQPKPVVSLEEGSTELTEEQSSSLGSNPQDA